MDRWDTSLSGFYTYPFRFLNLYSEIKDGSSWVHDKKKEKWKLSSSSWNNTLFLFVVIVFSVLPVISAGRNSDGVIVTQSDFQALKAIKHELIDFRGILKSWNDTGLGACAGGWLGIKCVNGEVIAIQLPWKGLGGRISEKIGQLQALRKLSLHDNVIAGPVPTSLSFLPNLRGVYLFNNRLSGSIPPSIGRSPLLQTLDLSNNQLSGTISPSLASSTRLYRLNLSYNALSGSIPVSFTQSPSLTFLALEHNNLSGSIPDTWGNVVVNKPYQLQYLTLDHNLLSGKIPVSISKLSMLEEINLSHNHINGTIPDELGSLLRLTVLDLSNNTINGTIPASFSNLSALSTLDLKSNLLDSQIPDTMYRMRNMSVLDLSNNKFIGHIPATIGNISRLTSLDLSGNNFSGEIPDSLVSLANLTSLDVSYNNLSGIVPSLLSRKFNSSAFVGNLELCGYSPSTPCASPPPQTVPSPVSGVVKPHRHRKLSTKDVILIASGALLVVLLLLCCMLLCCLIRKKANSRAKNGGKAGGLATTTGRGAKSVPAVGGAEVESGEAGGKLVHFDGPFVFAADDLLCATAEIMGKSTYGTAYKATLEDGNQVAVKRLREKITKGQKEFEAEVAELGKIRHPNILALRAYYLGPKGEKLLVYDYMSNGSLSSFLHARGPETTIDWPTRMRIAIDVGLSKLMTTAGNTNVIATAGTLGYRAPELSKIKNASTKTDVYSLGVIILELLTGKSPSEATDGLDLPQWVASIVKEEWTNEVFDVELMRDAPNIGDELLNTLKLALHCVDPTPTARPEAPQVLQKLEEIKPEMMLAATSSGDDGTTVQEKSDE
ncbi:probably inactive leucine-rich repeat receptor-like protein kinase IMK2 isoform X2 [Solanum lycopersicum]|uniref:probably inactive leucine-rich repeat receptor-like protein kinase IMK2 isoform X2 n=1 Tax=Solanum lycopersicum TaxID=4081 RepID=UPI0008FED1C0|nr:probably inactive leucine-rich repeat receptor-like protein kinase IMK2 isoform X2 [Solanum lycopersicum]